LPARAASDRPLSARAPAGILVAMALAERMEGHEQWLLSFEGKMNHLDGKLDQLTGRVDQLTQAVAVVAQNQASFVASLVELDSRLTARIDSLTVQMAALAEQQRSLAETVERCIRDGGNGRRQS
jgi:chromosome segregation ATPase